METKNKQIKPDHIQRFEKHLQQIELSKTDAFVIDSIKLTFFAGWAAAMDSLSDNWFQLKADSIKAELQGAVDRLHALEQAKSADGDPNVLDFSFDPDEKVNTSYLDFKID
jgi:hypothetical protein